jgi:hypothetical protein
VTVGEFLSAQSWPRDVCTIHGGGIRLLERNEAMQPGARGHPHHFRRGFNVEHLLIRIWKAFEKRRQHPKEDLWVIRVFAEIEDDVSVVEMQGELEVFAEGSPKDAKVGCLKGNTGPQDCQRGPPL